MKPTEYTSPGGKALPKSFQKTLLKLVANNRLHEDYHGNEWTTRRNPYSGVECRLCDFAADLVDWITSFNPIQKPFTCTDWHNARHTVHLLWPKEYYAIVD